MDVERSSKFMDPVPPHAVPAPPANPLESSKYAHLVMPIRHLADSWSVDVDADLCEYYDALSALDESSEKPVNFAEAGLVVHGSAVVWTKKVDGMHDQILHAMSVLSSSESTTASQLVDGANGLNSYKRRRNNNSKDGTEPSDENGEIQVLNRHLARRTEFLALSFQEELHLCLPRVADESALTMPASNPATKESLGFRERYLCARAPVALRRSKAQGENKTDLQLVERFVDQHTGALVVDEGVMLEPNGEETLVFSSLVQEQQEQLEQEIPIAYQERDGVEADSFDAGDDSFQEFDGVPDAMGGSRDSVRVPRPPPAPIESNPWALHNPFSDLQQSAKDKPFRKGRALTQATIPSREPLEEPASLAKKLPLSLNALVEALSAAEKLLDPTTSTFEDLFQHLRIPAPSAPRAPEAEEEDAEQEEEEEEFDEGESFEGAEATAKQQAQATAALTLAEADMRAITSTYAELVQAHVSEFIESARNWASESRLSVRVRAWHDFVEPLIETQETRPAFDLSKQERTLVKAFSGVKPEELTSFENLCANTAAAREAEPRVESWEVCRNFLAALHAANAGEVRLQHAMEAATEEVFDHHDVDGLSIAFVGKEASRKRKETAVA